VALTSFSSQRLFVLRLSQFVGASFHRFFYTQRLIQMNVPLSLFLGSTWCRDRMKQQKTHCEETGDVNDHPNDGDIMISVRRIVSIVYGGSDLVRIEFAKNKTEPITPPKVTNTTTTPF
jgi:hypothetical protein